MGRADEKRREGALRDRPEDKRAEGKRPQAEMTDEQRRRNQEQVVRREMKSSEKQMAEDERRKQQQGQEQPEKPAAEPPAEEAPRAEAEPVEPREKAACPIVAVGASAGGLEALQGLFDHVPDEAPMAFVVVQHRAADRTSAMKSLLEKHTRFPVKDIEDGMKVEPGTIYLAPADQDVAVMNGVLYLVEPSTHGGIRLPIDALLRSLARDQTDCAIGIILSGTGSDGTLGTKEIKAAGGMVMAQKEDQAKYDSMPRSAIDTGLVDFVLPVERMGKELAHYLRHPFLLERRPSDAGQKLENQLQKVFLMIRNETGHDFSHYKRNTILRRIARRLAVHQIQDLDGYLKLLAAHAEEIKVLSREMLITVTSFFRDREAFASLQQQVIRPLVQQKPAALPIRVWVAGCATGEEAYSIAILLLEEMDKEQRHHAVQIFGTDLDEESIETARRGAYPRSISADISADRLQRFFLEENNQYKVKTGIREMIVFAKHNLTRDAPFSKLDLLCCRNVLIYMDSTLQKKLVPMFHHTLNPGGYLLLGESESIGTFADLFAPVDARHKIFKRKLAEIDYAPETEVPAYPQARAGKAETPLPRKRAPDLSQLAERVILRDYSLPCVLVDAENNILYFNGDTSPFLVQPGGLPTHNILQMARPEVHHRLGLSLQRALHEKHVAVEKDIRVRSEDRLLNLEIVVRPVVEPGLGKNLALVIFKTRPAEEKKAGEPGGPPGAGPEQERNARIFELEQDLQATKEYLQTTVEELETSNEELKSSNEELQSTNEELQSTNEELDTSREELQSTNEELRTVNTEHQQKIDELSEAYDDLNNLLRTADVATLFLDGNLRIRRFTPAARKLFRLIERDVGRPIDDIATTVKDEHFLADIRSVLETLNQVEKEIASEDNRRYEMKAVPYRTAANIIDGVVVTFQDITDYKQAITTSEQTGELAGAIVETIREPLLILDESLKVAAANPAFYRHFRTHPEETLGRQIYELGNSQWDIPELRRLLEQVVPQNTRFDDFQVTHRFPNLGERTMLLNARQTVHQGAATGRILLAIEDVTDHERDARGKEASQAPEKEQEI